MGSPPKKVCALGVRIRRGVSMHGIALNVETDLSYFDLIVPCGIKGRAATSLRRILEDKTPALNVVKQQLARVISSTVLSKELPA